MTTTAIDGAGLLKAIIDSPGDDLPRLAYADWLEEAGQDLERAEFIRGGPIHAWQVWKWFPLLGDGLPGAPEANTYRNSVGGPWYASFPTSLSMEHRRIVRFRLGFPEMVSLPLAAWLEHGPALAAAYPLERVELSDREPGAGVWWFTDRWGQGPHRHWLPPCLRDHFPDVQLVEEGLRPAGEAWAYFGTHDAHDNAAAIDAISAALLAWAKGLPVT